MSSHLLYCFIGPLSGIPIANVAHCLSKLQASLKSASEEISGMVPSSNFVVNVLLFCVL